MSFVKLTCWLLLLLSINSVAAPVLLTDSSGRFPLGLWVDYLEDPSYQLTFHDVRLGPYRSRFTVVHQQAPNFGFRKAAFWFRFSVRNVSHDSVWVFEQALRGMGSIDMYVVEPGGRVIRQRGGDFIYSHKQQLAGAGYAFLLPVSRGNLATVYVRMTPYAGQAFFPMYLSNQFIYKQHDQLAVLLWGIYYGLLLTGFLYHLLLWMFTKQTAYAYLSLYLATYFLFEINRGLCPAQQYVWPTNNWLIQNGVNLFFTITLFAFVNFYTYVFGFRLESNWAKISTALVLGYIISLWLLPFVQPNLSRNLIAICQFLPTAGFLISIGFRKLRAGHIYTHFYLYSLLCFIGGGVLFSLNRAGSLPGDDFAVHYTGNLGSILEIILMSFGVAFAMRREQKNTVYFSEKARTAFTEGRAEELNLVALRLHHEAGNNLLLLLKAIERLSPEQPISEHTIKTLYSQAFDSYSMVRNWAYSATPETLLNQGLGIALQKLVDRANQTAMVSFLLWITGDEDKLPLKVQFELYYVCVELINNVIKHAQATEASLYVSIQEDIVLAECRDDGVGFIQPAASPTGSLGLDTINKRLARIGGTYETHRLIDQGMKVVVRIPLSD